MDQDKRKAYQKEYQKAYREKNKAEKNKYQRNYYKKKKDISKIPVKKNIKSQSFSVDQFDSKRVQVYHIGKITYEINKVPVQEYETDNLNKTLRTIFHNRKMTLNPTY